MIWLLMVRNKIVAFLVILSRVTRPGESLNVDDKIICLSRDDKITVLKELEDNKLAGKMLICSSLISHFYWNSFPYIQKECFIWYINSCIWFWQLWIIHMCYDCQDCRVFDMNIYLLDKHYCYTKEVILELICLTWNFFL